MKKPKFYPIISVLFLLALIGLPSWASPICAIESPKPGEYLEDRKLSVKFPDGRELSVVGHKHGETKYVVSLLRLADDDKSSNTDYINRAEGLIKSLDPTLKDYTEELTQLRKSLAEKKWEFIAVENGDRTFEFNKKVEQHFMNFALKNFSQREISDTKLLDQSFLILVGPSRYLRQTEPLLLKNVEIVPVEDDELMQTSLDLITPMLKARSKVLSKLPERDPFRQVVDNLVWNGMSKYDTLVDSTDSELISGILTMTPPEVKSETEELLKSILKFARKLRERDVMAVQKMLKRNQSGVYFVGEAHLHSIADLFRRACLSQISYNGSATDNRAFGAAR